MDFKRSSCHGDNKIIRKQIQIQCFLWLFLWYTLALTLTLTLTCGVQIRIAAITGFPPNEIRLRRDFIPRHFTPVCRLHSTSIFSQRVFFAGAVCLGSSHCSHILRNDTYRKPSTKKRKFDACFFLYLSPFLICLFPALKISGRSTFVPHTTDW